MIFFKESYFCILKIYLCYHWIYTSTKKANKIFCGHQLSNQFSFVVCQRVLFFSRKCSLIFLLEGFVLHKSIACFFFFFFLQILIMISCPTLSKYPFSLYIVSNLGSCHNLPLWATRYIWVVWNRNYKNPPRLEVQFYLWE